ncbi:hypothetical protein [Actinoplanes sp. NBRC 103695]|uniref:hypothetical protein n=1 Tax=Actinoplanes sp. NBRC 103695 TaxID=3032202 RepID=UPI0024A4AFBB|nr:hypothetical protein [Actinoplanes sp. NBRC 103695]GLZ01083.1 hypothetical protein Acsp02_83340 [Actinoplanes sp. NBRC 103695]
MAAGLVLLLTACTSGKSEAPRVATLQSAAPSSSAPAEAVAARPVVPIDATEADLRTILEPWLDCLVKEGGPKYKDAAGLFQKGFTEKDVKQDAVLAACFSKQPETYEDNQLRTDIAAFKDNQREWYRCAQAAGYTLTAPDPDTGQFGLTEVGPNGDFGSDKIQKCKRKAFSD